MEKFTSYSKVITYKKNRTTIEIDNDELDKIMHQCAESVATLENAWEGNGEMYLSEFFKLKDFVENIKWHFNFRRPTDRPYSGDLLSGNDPKAYYHDEADRPKKVNVGRPKK